MTTPPQFMEPKPTKASAAIQNVAAAGRRPDPGALLYSEAETIGFTSENPEATHRFGQISLADVIIDPRVQRPENPIEINQIAKNFNPAALGTVTVSRRVVPAGDGSDCALCGKSTAKDHIEWVLVDGQQRRAASLKVGYDRQVHADLHDGLTLKDEARLFRELNFRTAVNAITLFKTQLIEEDPHHLAVQAILDGLRIRFGTAKGYSAAKGAIKLVRRGNGVTHLEWALRQTQRLWDRGDGGVYDAAVVEALFLLHERDGNLINETRLFDKLANEEGSNSGLVRYAKTIQSVQKQKGSLADNVVRAIIDLYNKNFPFNSRARLAEWKPAREKETTVPAA